MRAYSIVELLVVLGVLALIAAITLEMYVTLNAGKALDTDAQRIVAELAEARSLTLAAKNDSAWGVHMASSSVTLFQGTYASGASSNVTTTLNPHVTLSTISLSGGGSEVTFQRLTGETTNSGSLILTLDHPSRTKTIAIGQTGLAQIQ